MKNDEYRKEHCKPIKDQANLRLWRLRSQKIFVKKSAHHCNLIRSIINNIYLIKVHILWSDNKTSKNYILLKKVSFDISITVLAWPF